ncbi:FG-GAP-like repeat-containing protein [Nostoc sp.]|uniref:FG-GAP-like repeat-containing protein n=1 Tax=Nostoc sp. TaxID=1180 RepID=UPI002FFC2EB8
MITATTTKQTLVIIDAGIDDHQILVQGIIPTAKVTVLNKHQDGIAQISALCHNYPAASIQIIAHGSPGNLQLGDSQLSLDNLHTYRQQLQQWQAAEILIYGCEVARGESGKTFIEQLHQLTGANIAASAQKIGNTQQGKTWELEVNIGQIDSTLALQPEIREAYLGVFANFATATNFSVGSSPSSVTVGDFNADGKLDLAVANYSSNTVSVLLGNGTGGFANATNFTVGNNLNSVTVGDFNGDSKLDLAVANLNYYGTVSVLLGNGTGGFNTATDFSVGKGSRSVIVADFNNDGKLDLAISNFYDSTVSVLLGNGTGGFANATNFAVGAGPFSVAVGDFNGDGKLDLATPNFYTSSTVSVLLGNGTGGFANATNFSVGNYPKSVSVGDFNGDGKLDLAVANGNTVSVLLGNGIGGFGTATDFTVGGGINSVTVGDFNGDGKLDLAVANGSTVSVLVGNGTGGFGTATDFSVGSNSSSVTVADFNIDGKLDLAVTNQGSNTVSVLLNTTPKITIAPGTNPKEGVTDGTFTITLDTPALVGGLVVNFNTTGSTATATTDYTLTAGTNITAVTANTFTIAAGQTTATLTVKAVADAVSDPNETVTVNLEASPDYILSVLLNANPSATLTIAEPVAPVISLPSNSISYTENSDATVLDLGATVSDTDSPNFNTGNLTVRFASGGTADDRLSIRNQGTGVTEINLDGREIYYGSTKIGNFSGGIGTESLVINLNANATIAATQALVRNIIYANDSQNPATVDRTVEIVLTDDTGTKSAAVTKTVQVTSVNDAPSVGNTLVLYDGSTGQKPDSSGAAANAPWFVYQAIAQPGTATTSATNSTTNLVTNNTAYAGYTNYGISGTSLTTNPLNPLFPTLDRNAGFVISFGLKVNSETLATTANKNNDGKTDRAGFSVIALDQDKKGIELGFLTDQIFAQDDGTTQKDPSLEPDTSGNPFKTLFTQAEGVTFDTKTLVNYDLAILGDNYTLFADGVAKLAGKVRDYTAAAIPAPIPDVYEKPNFLFFGDDTPSAGTNSNLAFVKVITSGKIPDQTIDQDTATAKIPFSISDLETAASNLTVTASSSNPNLIPNNGILISGTGSDRTITVTPATTKYGQATITLNVSDGNQVTSRTFVVNVNAKPTDLALSNTNVDENVAANTVIGTFSSTDPDNNTFTYSLVKGTGDTDNNAFTINGTSLQINTSPNFEAKSSYNIRVETKDAGGLTFEKPLTININDVNEAPTDLALSNTNVDENVAANTVIGTFSSTDPDQNDNFAYSLVSGIDDVDNNAFTIDGNTLKINNSPDFKTKPSYKIRIRTTDDGNLSFEKGLTINVNNGDEIPNRLTNPDDDVFNIQGEDVKTKLEIKLTGHNSQLVNELALFTVDDDKGTINGIAPGAEGYAKAALERSEVILSAIANTPNGFDTNNLSRLLELNSGQNFRFLLVQDGTLDAVRNNPNSIGKLLFSSVSTQKITDLGNDGFSLAWKDASGKSATDFNDLVVKINQTNQALPLGTNLQGQFQGEVIDLRDVKQSVKAEFSVYREASYNDYVGFYQVTDQNGGIDTNGDGKADILTGQAGYTQAAVRGRVAGIDLTASNQATATSTATFQPGTIFVPFIIVNGRPDALLDNNSNNDPTVYFPFLGANSDQADHIRLLASNTFGFEDLPGGGDKDFNDVIIKVNLTTTI